MNRKPFQNLKIFQTIQLVFFRCYYSPVNDKCSVGVGDRTIRGGLKVGAVESEGRTVKKLQSGDNLLLHDFKGTFIMR